MRYRLRTLLILLAVGPPVLAGGYWLWNVAGGLIALLFILGAWPLFVLIVPELGPLIRWLLKD